MRLFAMLILSVLLAGPVAAENLSGPYLAAAAVMESDFEFAGNANDQQEEGSGNLLAVGFRWPDRFSTELAYTDANDYKTTTSAPRALICGRWPRSFTVLLKVNSTLMCGLGRIGPRREKPRQTT